MNQVKMCSGFQPRGNCITRLQRDSLKPRSGVIQGSIEFEAGQHPAHNNVCPTSNNFSGPQPMLQLALQHCINLSDGRSCRLGSCRTVFRRLRGRLEGYASTVDRFTSSSLTVIPACSSCAVRFQEHKPRARFSSEIDGSVVAGFHLSPVVHITRLQNVNRT